jgi:hypothetical protein
VLGKIFKILGIAYRLLQTGHDLGLYDQNHDPIYNTKDLHDHLITNHFMKKGFK